MLPSGHYKVKKDGQKLPAEYKNDDDAWEAVKGMRLALSPEDRAKEDMRRTLGSRFAVVFVK